MTLLSDTPPGAVAGPATKPDVPHVGITFPYPTMAQRAERENAAKPEPVRLPIPFLAHGPAADGVVESTLSERGAALAARQQQAAAAGEAKQAAAATTEAAEKLVATAAKSLGLDAGEAKAAAELPPASPQEQAGQAAGAAKPAKARRAPMPMVQRLQVMEAVRSAPADEPDAELAARLSIKLDRAIGTGTIKDYRLQLGLKSVPMPSKAELRAKLAALQAELAAKEQPTMAGIESAADALKALAQAHPALIAGKIPPPPVASEA